MSMAFPRCQRLAAARRAESISESIDGLTEREAELLLTLDSMVREMRTVISHADADGFGQQAAEALADAFHDERKRLADALAEAEREAGDEI